MRAAIYPPRPKAIYILPKAHRAIVRMMAKGSIVARVLPLRCFLFLYQLNSLSMHLECTIVKELTKREYCYMSTPSL